MKQRQSSTKSVQKLCVAALMAALVFVSSQLQIQIPSILGFSRFHLGNSMCALSGLLLGPWWGGLASGVGSALFDLFHPAYLAEAPITLVTKGVYGLVSGFLCWRVFSGKPRYGVQALSTLCAALCYTAIYLGKTFFYNGILLGGLTPSAAWVAVLEKALLLFRDQGRSGERFADTIARLGFDNVEAQLLSDELLARKAEILGKSMTGGATC